MGKATVRDMNPEWLRTARHNATLGIPPQDAVGPDPIEMDIRRLGEQIFTQQGRPILKDAEGLAERLNRARTDLLDVKQRIGARFPVPHLDERLNADLQAARPQHVAHLVDKKRASTHLAIFRRDHGLTRPAEKQKKLLDVLARLSLFLVIETIINAGFYYNTGVGLLTGAMIAFFISFIIAALGFGTGFVARFRNATPLWERIGSWLAVVVLTAIAVYFASVTATFRALAEIAREHLDRQADLAAQAGDLFQKALGDGNQIFLLHVPFHEINATLLFGVAIIAFAWDVFVGYTCSDPIPGYSKASEQFERSDAAARAAEVKLRSDLLTAASELKSQRSRLVSAINDASRLHGDLAIKFERCSQRLAELAELTNNDHKQAVSECRVENATLRATPPPAYFGEPVAELTLDTDPLLFQNVRTALDTMRSNIADLEPFIDVLNPEVAELEQRRAVLAEAISETVKRWDLDAEQQIDDEARKNYVGATEPATGPLR
jgi:hypothetical protein